jgi:hypothetical protein
MIFTTGHAAHAACGALFFTLGATGAGLQGWHAVKRLRGRDKGQTPIPHRRLSADPPRWPNLNGF